MPWSVKVSPNCITAWSMLPLKIKKPITEVQSIEKAMGTPKAISTNIPAKATKPSVTGSITNPPTLPFHARAQEKDLDQ